MHKTVSIGGATYDLFVRLGGATSSVAKDGAFSLPLGSKMRVKEVLETAGGGACNTAVSLARLGCDAGFCGVIGSDQWGQFLLKTMEREHVDTTCATIVEGEMSSFSIILSGATGERVILYDPGTNEHLHDATFHRDAVSCAKWVYLNHIPEHSCVIQDDLIEIVSAPEPPRLTWNPGGCQIDVGLDEKNNCELLRHTTLLLVNKEEALRFTKTDDVNKAMKRLIDAGPQHICITDGAQGTMGWDGMTVYHCPTVANAKVIDTTGAGDAFGAGVTWALLEGLDLPTALRAGTINATGVVATIGAQPGLLTHSAMQEQLERTPLDVRVIRL